jgi:DNA modification methylase
MRPTGAIKPYEKNPRHNEQAVEAVAASIREFGFRQPIVVDGDGVIICGHTRWKAAQRLGLERVPVHVATDLTPAQVKAYRLADNATGELAEWDLGLLGIELAELEGMGVDLGLLGLSDKLLADLSREAKAGLTEPDDVPEAPKKAITRPGDLWLLGEHRLLCGDSTVAEDVGRLFEGGERGSLMNTDPPYGINYDVQTNYDAANEVDKTSRRSRNKPIQGDRMDGAELQAFLEGAIRAAVPHLEETAAFYLWHPMLTQGTFFAAAAAAADILIHRQIIWVKGHFIFGRGDYHWQHELCFYGWRRGHRCPFYGERNQTTIWQIGMERGKEHPTQKPVELFAIPLRNHTRSGEVCYEPFAGSGPQFIAAEQLGRRCFGVEIEPLYCDVVVRRWEEFTARKAERRPQPGAAVLHGRRQRQGKAKGK